MIRIKYDLGEHSFIEELENSYFDEILKSTKISYSKIIHKKLGLTLSEKKNLPINEVFIHLKKNNHYFRFLFHGYSLYDILLMKPEKLYDFITKIEYKLNIINKEYSFSPYFMNKSKYSETNRIKINKNHKLQSKEDLFNEFLGVFFNYERYQGSTITNFFSKIINSKTCFYCNRAYITNFKMENKDKIVSTFQLDHFYENKLYPYLSLSFYNFIPCCSTCNSVLKNTAIKNKSESFYSKKSIAPNNPNFFFDEYIVFKSFYFNQDNLDKNNIGIKLGNRTGFNRYSDYAEYIKLFKLNERYIHHVELLENMKEKRDRYPSSKIKDLSKFLDFTEDQIKADIFGESLFSNDLSLIPLSKLMKDISEELGILKQ